jgi:hypothetical protein
LAITPSWPLSSAAAANADAASACAVTIRGTRFPRDTIPSIALNRFVSASSTNGAPSRYNASKKNGVIGNELWSAVTSSFRPNRRIVTWNGCGVPSGRNTIASPSSTIWRAGIARTISTTSGTATVTSLRFREYTRTSSSALCA